MPVDPRIQRLLDAPMTTATDLRFASVKGYVQPPGTGPEGVTCRSCKHATPTSSYGRERVCALARNAPPVPIALETAACGRWEQFRR